MYLFFEIYDWDSWGQMFMHEISDISSICFFGHTKFLCNFWMHFHLLKIAALFLLVKSSRYEAYELLKNDFHILLYYDNEQTGHISYMFHEKINNEIAFWWHCLLMRLPFDVQNSEF